jgi:hypothetical protein
MAHISSMQDHYNKNGKTGEEMLDAMAQELGGTMKISIIAGIYSASLAAL